MAIDAFVKPLLQLEIFQGLTPLQITEIARRAYRVVYKPGDVLVRDNEIADSAIVIVSGEAVCVSNSPSDDTARRIPTGSIVAEMAMLIETEPASTIIATSPVKALRIAREEVHQQMIEDQGLAEHFSRQISARLRDVLEELRRIDTALEGMAAIPSRASDFVRTEPQAAVELH